MLKVFVELLHRVFNLPEFVICRVNPFGFVEYLCEVRGSQFQQNVWTTDINLALLFVDKSQITDFFKDFDPTNHLIISYLDEWSDYEIKKELNLT